MLTKHLSPRALVKEMLHSSSLYSLASVGQRLASLILIPIVTRHLLPADYGALDLLEQVGILSSALLGISFSGALGYFYFDERQPVAEGGRGRVVMTTIVGSVLVGIVASLISWWFAPVLSRSVFHSNAYLPYVRLVLASLPLMFLLEAAQGWLRIENRTYAFVVAAIGRTLLTVAGVVVLVGGKGYRIIGVLGSNLASTTAVAVLLVLYCYRIYGASFDRALFARMLRYSIPLGLSSIAILIIHFGDRFILPHYRSLGELGVYAIAYKLGMMISMVHGSFHTYWSAQVFQIVRRKDAETILPRIFTYMVTVLSFCGLGLIVAALPVLRILAQPAYYGAAVLVPVIVAAYFVRAIGYFIRAVFFAEGVPGNDASTQWVGAGICLVGYFALIPRYGAMGAAVATLLAFFTVAVISMVWVHRIHRYTLEAARLMKLGVITGGLLIVHFVVPVASLGGQIAFGALLLAAYLLLLIALRVPHQSEWDMGVAALRKLMRQAPIGSTPGC